MVWLAHVLVFVWVLIEARIDVKNWGNVKHGKWLIVAMLIVASLVWIFNDWCIIFIYPMLTNPTINIMRKLPLFYIGNTARTDIILKNLFGKQAGLIFFLMNLIAYVLCLVTGIG